MRYRRLAAIALAASGALAGVAARADMESAEAAYGRGDHAAAFAEFQELAGRGDSLAMLWLGYLHERGEGTAQSYGEAMRYYRMSVDHGNVQACQYVATLYAEGAGVEQDLVEAVRWYRRAADQGYAYGQYSLGYAYEHGQGAPRDRGAARRWYEAAADQGYDEARTALQRLADLPF